MWCFRLHWALSEARDWWIILVGTLIPASLNAIGLRLPVGECHPMTSRQRGATCAAPWTTGSAIAHTVEKGPIKDTVDSVALGATAEVNEVISGTLVGMPTSGSTETAGARNYGYEDRRWGKDQQINKGKHSEKGYGKGSKKGKGRSHSGGYATDRDRERSPPPSGSASSSAGPPAPSYRPGRNTRIIDAVSHETRTGHGVIRERVVEEADGTMYTEITLPDGTVERDYWQKAMIKSA